jgi:hypothetical protein
MNDTVSSRKAYAVALAEALSEDEKVLVRLLAGNFPMASLATVLFITGPDMF